MLDFIPTLFNRIVDLNHYPDQRKYAEIKVAPKSGKPPIKVSSIHPISLLPALSIIFEKILLTPTMFNESGETDPKPPIRI